MTPTSERRPLIEAAYLDQGDLVMPGEAGARAGHQSRNEELVALELLCFAYAHESDAGEWIYRMWVTLRALDHKALAMIATTAIMELARLGFDAVDADRRAKEEANGEGSDP